jgi:hypothetical protein
MRIQVARASHEDVYRDFVRLDETSRMTPDGRPIPEGVVCRVTIGRRSALLIMRGIDAATAPDRMRLDERTRQRLAIEADQEVEVKLEPVGLLAQFRWAWTATDPAYRIGARMALLSVVLGVAGLALGAVALFK